MTALAVMIALVGAMFVAMGSAGAQTSGIDIGDCAVWDPANPTTTINYVAIGDSCGGVEIDENEAVVSSNVAVVAGRDAGAVVSDHDLIAVSVGTTQVTVGDTQYRISVIAKPTVIVSLGDTDGIVSNLAPAPSVTVTLRGFTDTHAAASNISISTNGIYFTSGTGAGTTTTFLSAAAARGADDGGAGNFNSGKHFVLADNVALHIAGAPVGEYKITATVTADDVTPRGATATVSRKVTPGEAMLTIGDPGSVPASAMLSLGNSTSDNPTTVADETIPESGSKGSTKSINMVYSVNNSLGSAANNSDLNTVQVIAPNGVINPTGSTVLGTKSDTNAITAKGSFTVGSVNGVARTVEVFLIATGSGGAAESERITLTFTGGAGAIALGDASGTLLSIGTDADDSRDMISFSFSTTDSAGNTVGNPQNLFYVVTAPDGSSVSITAPDGSGRLNRVQEDAPGAREGSNNQITLTSKGTLAKPLASGEYTLKITAGALSTTATFTVAGVASDVAVTVDNMTPSSFGELVKATAMVTDADGNPAADGTLVTFKSSPASGGILDRVGKTGAVKTRGGVASATFAAVGSGDSVVSASADDAAGVVVVTSTAGASDSAMPEEEASLGCLSSLSGFSTWTCDVEASASEIFDWISSRGATALHLNSNRMWVRYSVVDGAMVPGSSDFMVTKSDILYISN